MLTWSPPGRSFIKVAQESSDIGRIRYEEIATSAIHVAYDPAEKPIFQGKYGRAQTLALLMSISFFESGYRKDVDLGLGSQSRGDSGRSWCLVQIQLDKPNHDGKTKTRILLTNSGYKFIYDPTFSRGWGGEDLVQDRTKCYRVGLRMARQSFSACSRLPLEERLSAFASGKCNNPDGQAVSRSRVRLAQSWLARSRPPLPDSEVLNILNISPIVSPEIPELDL
jgi:hypothetical protein